MAANKMVVAGLDFDATKLDRHELPIQSIKERNEDCTATVPVHLNIMKLPPSIRTDMSLISGARETVRRFYDGDMAYYLGVLRKDGIDLPWLKGYERFNEGWELNGAPDENGFLTLNWRENDLLHLIRFCSVPVILYNQHNEHGEFYNPNYIIECNYAEYMGRSITQSETIFMPPAKMRAYGTETLIAKIDEQTGVAEVQGYAFCSDYHANMAKALLLRDFAVVYLNRLLEKTEADVVIRAE